jgi:hypothetical protein
MKERMGFLDIGLLFATVCEPRILRLSLLNYSALTGRWNRR